MEVHHHAHTSRKKWTHYFWEFLMLFLAVTLGFLVENQREHYIEKKREKQYIRSFSEDLAADTAELNARIYTCSITINAADSLILLLSHPKKEKYAGDIYYFFRFIHRSQPFTVSDRTIVQLRNAGGMRLVSNKTVSDSMVNYYKSVDFLTWIFDEHIELKRSLRPHFNKLLLAEDFRKVIDDNNQVVRPKENLTLKNADEESLNTIMLILENIKGINQGTRKRLSELKVRAIAIRDFLKREYHLK